ncbi:cell wall-binding repeat-containing protein [Clostridioides sp. ES-S-0123-01]|uniref:cell wall-binding repeat-containing protein n=2 Tax=unclassified Clostridioides TaxID=2635829 RepID=UPI001D10A66A|nr:cell wall-binding repeat-containing protein [Clostridioides sp. ES-S-0123-01]
MKTLSKKAVILSLSLVVVSPLVHDINAQDIEKNMEVRYEARQINNLENMTMEEAFPDENFRKVICDKLGILDDGNPIGTSKKAIIESTKDLILGSKSIENLSGINYFIGLENFSCRGNQLTNLDLSNNINLKELYCNENQLTSLDLRNNKELITVHCGENNLTNLVIENSKLEKLNCRKNNLKNLDITKATNLTTLLCFENELSSLNLSKNQKLKILKCEYNNLNTLDVSTNLELQDLNFSFNQLTNINLDNNKELLKLSCQNNKLQSLNLKNHEKLVKIYCNQEKLSNLNIENCINLEDLTCSESNLQDLYISSNKNLKYLDCAGNKLTNLNIGNNIELIELYCYGNEINVLDISKNIDLENLTCYKNKLDSLNTSKNKNIKYLICAQNELVNLNLSDNVELVTLNCQKNQLTNLDVNKNGKIRNLDCSQNELTSLDVSSNVLMSLLNCSQNKLTSLDVSNNVLMRSLNCSQNELTSLDVTKNTELDRLYCRENRLTSLDVSKNTKLEELDWSNQKKSTSGGNSSGGGGGSSSTNEESSKPSTATSNSKLVGSDRNETSVKISQKGWNKADNIVLINDSSISDALSATPFAKSKDAPILLTKNDSLNKLTEKEIKRLEVKNVYIVGGLKSVGEKVVSDLKTKGLNVIRISGNDRYETSIKLAKELDKNSKLSKVVVVNGEKGLADAVSMGAISAKEEMPILLTNQNDDMKDIKDLIGNKEVSKSYVIGGESLFNTKEVSNTLPSVTKIAGSDRTETNSKVINHFYRKEILNDLYVAKNGMNKQDDLVDALSVGVLAGKTESPVVLVGNGLDNSQKELIKNKKFKNITQIGGDGNEKAFSEVENLVK